MDPQVNTPAENAEVDGERMAEGYPVPKPPPSVKIGPVGNYAEREPVVTTASLLGLLTGIISYAVAKGWFDAADEAFLIGLAPTVAGLVAGLIARQFVTPNAKADMAVDVAYLSNPRTDSKPEL